jgi:nucleoid-associated protein YgaU
MKITRLHLLLFLIALLAAGYVYQFYFTRMREREEAAVQLAKEAEQKKIEAEQQKQQMIAQQKEVARQVIAVAGEYWIITKKDGRDVAQGQETLHKAKELLAQDDFYNAIELARQSIDELKAAPTLTVYYTVRHGDTLWKISKMPQHFGCGGKWTKIWRANEKKIPDFDHICPHQVLLIPKTDNKMSEKQDS